MIRPLPPVPTRDDPVNFALKGDAFLAALPGFVDDANALEQSMQLQATVGTSTSTITVGTGSKTLTASTGKAWVVGAWVYVFASAAVSNYMVGRVTAYNATTGALTVNVSAIDGSGTYNAWIIGLATPQIDTHLLPRDGSRAMTAELPLSGNALGALGAVPKQQLDGQVVSFTPTVAFGPGSSAVTGFSASGEYRIVGKVVICNICFTFSSPVNATGTIASVTLPQPVKLFKTGALRNYKHFNVQAITKFGSSSEAPLNIVGIVDQSDQSLLTFNSGYNPSTGSGNQYQFGSSSASITYWFNMSLVYESA